MVEKNQKKNILWCVKIIWNLSFSFLKIVSSERSQAHLFTCGPWPLSHLGGQVKEVPQRMTSSTKPGIFLLSFHRNFVSMALQSIIKKATNEEAASAGRGDLGSSSLCKSKANILKLALASPPSMQNKNAPRGSLWASQNNEMGWGAEMEGTCFSHFSHTNDLKIDHLCTPGKPKGLSQISLLYSNQTKQFRFPLFLFSFRSQLFKTLLLSHLESLWK